MSETQSPEPQERDSAAKDIGLEPQTDDVYNRILEQRKQQASGAEPSSPGPGNHDIEINADNLHYYRPAENLTEEEKEQGKAGLEKLKAENPWLAGGEAKSDPEA